MIIITERNRNGAKIWIDDNNILQSNEPYVLEYSRYFLSCDYNKDKSTLDQAMSIDPSGGPMINVGDHFKKDDGIEVVITGFKEKDNKQIGVILKKC